MAVTIVTASVTPSTRVSMVTPRAPAILTSGMKGHKVRSAPAASGTPSIAPITASRPLSASICRMRRPRDAPSAVRTVISRSRAPAVASNRFPTLMQAIRSTHATAPSNISRAGCRFLFNGNTGTSPALQPSFVAGYARPRSRPMRSSSGCASPRVMPGASRPRTAIECVARPLWKSASTVIGRKIAESRHRK